MSDAAKILSAKLNDLRAFDRLARAVRAGGRVIMNETKAAEIHSQMARELGEQFAAHPQAGLIVEMLALDQRHVPDSESSPRDYLVTVSEIADVDDPPDDLPAERDRLLMGAAVCLAGVQTCDATKKKSKP